MHLIKLAVGIKNFDQLSERQLKRYKENRECIHIQRLYPRKLILKQGFTSIFWVINGNIQARQAIKEIVKNHNNKIFFIDDISANLLSAHKEVKGIRLIHYISDERLSMLAKTPPEIHFRATDWKNIYEYIKNETI